MRTYNILRSSVLAALLILLYSSIALAATAYWTDWTSATAGASPQVNGTITIGSNTINVTYTATVPYQFVQTSGGTDFWAFPGPTSPYDSLNRPTGSDIIALTTLSTGKTITFSQAVQNPLFAFTSWNGNTAEFGTPISILSFAQGFWGTGTPVLFASGTGFNAVGEETGVIELNGTFTSITFADSLTENWHGFTIGVRGEATTGVPEPATMLLLGLGLVGLAGIRRK